MLEPILLALLLNPVPGTAATRPASEPPPR